MQLVYFPDPILREVCIEAPEQPMGDPDDLIITRARIACKMWKIMRKKHGVGLAAPQVGLNIRMFVFSQDGCNQAIWNPILSCVEGIEESIEGCLSLPKINVTMQRATSCIMKGLGVNGRHLYYVGNSMMTRVWQHEIDHLDGNLIIDNMSPEETLSNKDAIEILLGIGKTE